MFIVKSMLTTFIVSIIFRGGWCISETWVKLKIEPPLANLAFFGETHCSLSLKYIYESLPISTALVTSYIFTRSVITSMCSRKILILNYLDV
jgi:hypothetical protein